MDRVKLASVSSILSIPQNLFIVHNFILIIVDKLDGVVMEMSWDSKIVCTFIGIL